MRLFLSSIRMVLWRECDPAAVAAAAAVVVVTTRTKMGFITITKITKMESML